MGISRSMPGCNQVAIRAMGQALAPQLPRVLRHFDASSAFLPIGVLDSYAGLH